MDEPSSSSSSSQAYKEPFVIRYCSPIQTLFDFPELILDKIFSHFTYDELSKLRGVSKDFNSYVQNELNKGFLKLGKVIESNKCEVKKELPKRESLRRKHRLTRINEIYSALDTRYSLLDLTFKKFMRQAHPKLTICFIPGKVLDEFNRVLDILQRCRNYGGEFTGDATELLKELRDLSSMAIEYCEDQIIPPLEELAEKEGLPPFAFAYDIQFPRKKPPRQLRKDVHELALSPNFLSFDRIPNNSPLNREVPKTLQDAIDALDRKYMAQQMENQILRATLIDVLDLLKEAIPDKKEDVQRIMLKRRLMIETPKKTNNEDNDEDGEDDEDNIEPKPKKRKR